jgi:hypothetical protein
LVVGHETKGIILKAGAATCPFGGKVYWWRVGREKRNLQGHLGVYVDHSWVGIRTCNQLSLDIIAVLRKHQTPGFADT